MSNGAHSLLWYTDRSRLEDGLDRCLRSRLLGYHWGPFGYGIRKRSESIPLATGIYLHRATEAQDRYLLEQDQLPPDEVVRAGVAEAVNEYERIITLRGLRNLDESERTETIIQEQKALIEGLAWAYRLHFLPWLHEHSRVIEAEREELLVLGCTCGLGDRIGTADDHDARGCEGVGYQSRPDLLTEYRQRPGVIAYWEKKSAGQTGERWETEWETKTQFVGGAKAAQERLGLPISEAWVIGQIKGRREGEYDYETRKKDGPLKQQSVLCYGWRRPGLPPFEQPDWAASYDYVDAEGKNRRLGKAYTKVPIQQIAEDLPDVKASGVSIPEFWARWIGPEALAKTLAIVGPLQVNQVIVDEYFEEVLAHETWWRGVVWELYTVLQEQAGGEWTHPAYQQALRRLVPRSWSCRRYGKRHQCQFVPICFQHEGWQEPLEHGFMPRRPHHALELAQVEARGLAPEGGWEDEEEHDA